MGLTKVITLSSFHCKSLKVNRTFLTKITTRLTSLWKALRKSGPASFPPDWLPRCLWPGWPEPWCSCDRSGGPGRCRCRPSPHASSGSTCLKIVIRFENWLYELKSTAHHRQKVICLLYYTYIGSIYVHIIRNLLCGFPCHIPSYLYYIILIYVK